MLKLPELKSSGDADFDAVRRGELQKFADWIAQNGGLLACEGTAERMIAYTQGRLANCYWHGETDRAFDVPDIGMEHEANTWRRERQAWRNTAANLALFRAANPQGERIAA